MVMNNVKINVLFKFDKGNASSFDDYYDVIEECPDSVAYISAATTRNGINGFVLPKESDIIFKPMTISVAAQGQGSVSYATIQPHKYIASKLVLCLTPNLDKFKEYNLSDNIETLSIICAIIRKYRWRFSFGRTVDEERLGELYIDIDKIKSIINTISQ
jgi:hypothetical protein